MEMACGKYLHITSQAKLREEYICQYQRKPGLFHDQRILLSLLIER